MEVGGLGLPERDSGTSVFSRRLASGTAFSRRDIPSLYASRAYAVAAVAAKRGRRILVSKERMEMIETERI